MYSLKNINERKIRKKNITVKTDCTFLNKKRTKTYIFIKTYTILFHFFCRSSSKMRKIIYQIKTYYSYC